MTRTAQSGIRQGGAMLAWLDQPERPVEFWLGKHCVVLAWLGLLLAAVSAPHGSGISLCWFHDVTGVPCPGCGMTRSLSCALRGMFLESVQYHPMGILILALFVFTAGQSVLPKVCREGIVRFLQSRAMFFNALYLIFVISFVSFGVVRALHALVVRL